MKADQIFQELKDLAERLDITVSEQSFRNTGVKAKSGYCKVHNQDRCIIDRNLRIHRKIGVLAECLSGFPHEDHFVVPAVREILERYSQKGDRQPRRGNPD
jgi:hypothetical protein